MKHKALLFTLFFFGFISNGYSANVDTVKVYSPSMNKYIQNVIITPNSYKIDTPLPTVYLLHGYSGNHTDWVEKAPIIKKLADAYKLIIVCPDGMNSWYLDSPIESNSRYETFVSKELVTWVDNNYSTKKAREFRAITGLSMGGHGALFLALRHQNIFGSCGSMSGGVAFQPFPNNWNLKSILGKKSDFQKNWRNLSVMGQLHLLEPQKLKIVIDCGTADFFYNVNKKLHEKLLYLNIPHTFISRKGKHDWNYWSNAIQYQMLFFYNVFEKTTNTHSKQ